MDCDTYVHTPVYFASDLKLSSALRYIVPRAAKRVPGGE